MTHRTILALSILSFSLAGCGFPKTVDAPPAVPVNPDGPSSPEAVAGRESFTAKCNGCHGYPDLGTIPEDKWPAIVKRMAGKADLTEKAGDDVLKYILAARKDAKVN